MELELILKGLLNLVIFGNFFFFIVGSGVCVSSSSYSFQSMFCKRSRYIVDILEICMWVFDGARLNFDRIVGFLNLVIFAAFLHCRVWSLCNQLILLFPNFADILWIY